MLSFDLPHLIFLILDHVSQVNLGAHTPAPSWLLGKLVFGLRRAESSERRLGDKKRRQKIGGMAQREGLYIYIYVYIIIYIYIYMHLFLPGQ